MPTLRWAGSRSILICTDLPPPAPRLQALDDATRSGKDADKARAQLIADRERALQDAKKAVRRASLG
jgi:hypothetical protein